jgi:hypothetical protein
MLMADVDYTKHNYYIYRNSDSGLWHLLPWDKDVSMSRTNYPLTGGTASEPPGATIGGPNHLYTRLMEVPLFRTIWVHKLEELLATTFQPATAGPLLDQLQLELIIDGEADYTKQGWEDNRYVRGGASSLTSWISNRVGFVNSQLGSFTTPVPRPLLVNEVMARNGSTVADGAGEFDDWIELVNPTQAPVDASGWFLTDDAGDPTRWEIPPGTIVPPGGHLLIWADAEPHQGALHASFRISGSGEGVYLFSPLAAGNQLIDLVALEPQLVDVSFGRRRDAGAIWDELPTPTPGAPNRLLGDLPPVVWGLSLEPPTPLTGQSVTLRAQVTDDLGSVAGVTVSHDPGSGVATQPMVDDGLGEDRAAGDFEYATVLPPAAGPTIVRHWIDATDGSAQTTTLPEDAPVGALAYGVPSERGCLVINEVCADNETILVDGAGDADDWIEIHNAGVRPVDLSGMFLTDDLENSTKWAIPQGTWIQPGATRLFWADDEPLEGPLHATFRLSSRGDSVGLFDTWASGNRLLDCVSFGHQLDDHSLARAVDGDAMWIVNPAPTPNASNGPGAPCCPASACGDCDLDGDIDVLDALAGARHSVGLITLVSPALENCDVNANSQGTTVDTLDALLIAQFAVGAPVQLECCP